MYDLVAAGRPSAFTHAEPDVDRVERRLHRADEARFLRHFARRRLFERLAFLLFALRQLPPRAAFGGDETERDALGVATINYPARRHLEAGVGTAVALARPQLARHPKH